MLADVQTAARFLAAFFPPSRVLESAWLSDRTSASVHLKMDSELPTGSFKVRGAMYALGQRQRAAPVAEVLAASTGNHGAAVAYAARALGVPATIFVPARANSTKLDRIRRLGARIVEAGADLSEVRDRLSEYARTSDGFVLDDSSDDAIPIGTGTIALELAAQIPAACVIYVPVGDSALIRGVAATAKQINPAIRIVGVQAEGAPSYFLSWQSGRAEATAPPNTIADGLATNQPLPHNVAALRELVDDFALVSDDAMRHVIEQLAIHDHVIAEPASAAAVAGLLDQGDAAGRHQVALITGCNIAEDVLRDALGRGRP